MLKYAQSSKLCCCIFQDIQLVRKFSRLTTIKEQIMTEEM